MRPLNPSELRAMHEGRVAHHLVKHAKEFEHLEWQITGLKFIVGTAVLSLGYGGYRVLEWWEKRGKRD